jgi:hypothetical protein
MGHYDRAIVCRAGHVINDRAETAPQFNKKFCAKCGAAAVDRCENCGSMIQGDYIADGIAILSTFEPTAPEFCDNCGAPYPWKQTAPDLSTATVAVNRKRLEKAEQLLGILAARATKGTYSDLAYRQAREALLKDAELADLFPSVVKSHRSLDDFWGFIKVKYAKYDERRDYLREQFDPLLNALEQALRGSDTATRASATPADSSDGLDWLDDFVRSKVGKTPIIEEPDVGTLPAPSNRIFVVHGHEAGPKEAVARLLERQSLQPIILHEQPNRGRTVIEKFERSADVGFAIILMTGDDVGRAQDETDLKRRARQNVILELAYFIGKLGREKVVALATPGIEVPSDIAGVIYTPLDRAGAWKMQVLRELKDAGYAIDFALIT